jgi:predicted nucleotidyltransferase
MHEVTSHGTGQALQWVSPGAEGHNGLQLAEQMFLHPDLARHRWASHMQEQKNRPKKALYTLL